MIAKHEVDELPDYLFELSRFDEYPVKLTRTIGFEAGWRGSRSQEHALMDARPMKRRCGSPSNRWDIHCLRC